MKFNMYFTMSMHYLSQTMFNSTYSKTQFFFTLADKQRQSKLRAALQDKRFDQQFEDPTELRGLVTSSL